jgi:hypothetical protein
VHEPDHQTLLHLQNPSDEKVAGAISIPNSNWAKLKSYKYDNLSFSLGHGAYVCPSGERVPIAVYKLFSYLN